MTTQFSAPPPTGWIPPPPKKKQNTGIIVGAVLAGLVLFGGCAAAISSGGDDDSPSLGAKAVALSGEDKAAADAEARRIAENKAAAEKAAADEEARQAAVEAEAALPPDPTDFKLEVVVLEKTCFGSAGCNVVYRIDPTYTGTRDAVDLEVTYEVTGGEDPSINTFTIDDEGTATYDSQEIASTPSSKSVLKATVTSVRKAP